MSQQPRSTLVNHIVDNHYTFKKNFQELMGPLRKFAESVDECLPNSAEKSAGIRKLVEAYDCFIRASKEGDLIQDPPQSVPRQTILHITVGDSDWEPTQEEIQIVNDLFSSAARVTDSTVTTRTGVSVKVVDVSTVNDVKVTSVNVDKETANKLIDSESAE